MFAKSIAAVMAVGMTAAAATNAHAALAYALTDDNSIVGFDTTAPALSISSIALRSTTNTAIQDLIGIDYRPQNGLLYGVGKFGAIYTINPLTGVATQTTTLSQSLSGSRFGFDFNPTNGLLRITNDADQSFAVDVTTGVATLNVNSLNPGNPNIVGSAYTNNFAGATTTTLYAIDSVANALYTQNTTTSALTFVGPLNFDISAINGFDIATVGGVNTAYAVMQQVGSGSSEFFQINLSTGAAQSFGPLAGGDVFDGLAIVPAPEPTTLVAMTAGAGLVALRRRRQA